VKLAVIQQQFSMKECDILGGQDIPWYSDPSYVSQVSEPPHPRTYARDITHSIVWQCCTATTQIDWKIENLTVRHTRTPLTVSSEICIVDFDMQNTCTIFHHNPL